jgi:hypothetical protein
MLFHHANASPPTVPLDQTGVVTHYSPPRAANPLANQATELLSDSSNVVDLFPTRKRSNSTTLDPISLTGTAEVVTSAHADLTVTSSAAKTENSRHKEEIDSIAKSRIQMMAANYAAGKMNREILARLEILNHRLLDKLPRVSKEQVESLERVNEEMSTLQAEREAQARRLGIQV